VCERVRKAASQSDHGDASRASEIARRCLDERVEHNVCERVRKTASQSAIVRERSIRDIARYW
jgi:hypothetical protein